MNAFLYNRETASANLVQFSVSRIKIFLPRNGGTVGGCIVLWKAHKLRGLTGKADSPGVAGTDPELIRAPRTKVFNDQVSVQGRSYGLLPDLGTFLAILHCVPRNSAVSGAGWGQPAEDDGGAAPLLCDWAVGGCGDTLHLNCSRCGCSPVVVCCYAGINPTILGHQVADLEGAFPRITGGDGVCC